MVQQGPNQEATKDPRRDFFISYKQNGVFGIKYMISCILYHKFTLVNVFSPLFVSFGGWLGLTKSLVQCHKNNHVHHQVPGVDGGNHTNHMIHIISSLSNIKVTFFWYNAYLKVPFLFLLKNYLMKK